jgi:hypothetical protein
VHNSDICICGRPRHPGRCAAMYRRTPPPPKQQKRWRPTAVHRTREWKSAARAAKDGLVRAFMAGEDTGPWQLKLEELLRMK